MELFSVDPGNKKSGVVKMIGRQITKAFTVENEEVVKMILENSGRKDFGVLYEDIKPYSTRLGQQTIDTVKFIGQLEYRLKEAGIANKAIYRWEVKKWVFDTFPAICEPRIMTKITKKGLQGKDGGERKPSFVFVDDRIVIAAMKEHWYIPTPKPGRKSLHGLSTHSWQALAVISVYLETKNDLNLST